MLEVKNITKGFGGVKAVNNCSFKIPERQITALIGPNGAGKTTLLDIISGLVKPEVGSILFNTGSAIEDITGWQTSEIMNFGISRTFQQVRLFHYLSILDHLRMVEDNEDTRLFFNVFKITKTASHDLKTLKEYVASFGIDKSLDTLVSDLSYGQKKLLQLALAFKKHHHLLLLDEPVAGVNTVTQKIIEDLILSLKEKGETILIIEHDMDFIRRLADNLIVLDEGRVLIEGEPDKVLSDKKVLEAYLGE